MSNIDKYNKQRNSGIALSLLGAASFLSHYDRFIITPLIVVVSIQYNVGLAMASLIASGYFLAYGVGQPFWGILSDRAGRVRAIGLALALAALSGAGTVWVDGFEGLLVLRCISGFAFGGVVPASLAYLGDEFSDGARRRYNLRFVAIMAVGMGSGMITAGALSSGPGWKWLFSGTGLIAGCLAVFLTVLGSRSLPIAGGWVKRFRHVIRSRWLVRLCLIAFLEGFSVVGILAMLPTIVASKGIALATGGAFSAMYCVGVLAVLLFSGYWTSDSSGARSIAIGGIALVAGVLLCVFGGGAVGFAIGAFLLGICWGVFHTFLTTWVSGVVNVARGFAVSLFAAALFAGNASSVAVGALVSVEFGWDAVGLLNVAVGVLCVILTATMRRSFLISRRARS